MNNSNVSLSQFAHAIHTFPTLLRWLPYLRNLAPKFLDSTLTRAYTALTRSSSLYSTYGKDMAHNASQTGIFNRLTLSVLAASVVISVTRGIALYHYYRAPMALMNHFEVYEIPCVLNVTGYVCLPGMTSFKEAELLYLAKETTGPLFNVSVSKSFAGPLPTLPYLSLPWSLSQSVSLSST
ncbi:hypothetical protein BC835DRAFT_1409973 [Cytidiella melzeri]|nr:hypothetical protein BC835DRAFT_1409973 [Cytidiella melzeri]